MNAKISALFGLAVTVVGLFLPMLKSSGRPYNFLQATSGGDITIMVVILSALVIALILMGRIRHIVWPAAAALGITGLCFLTLQSSIDEGLFGYFSQTQIIPIGWLTIACGFLIVVAAGLFSWASAAATMASGAANERNDKVPVAPIGADAASRFAQLKSLHEQGLISAQELEAKRAEILAGL